MSASLIFTSMLPFSVKIVIHPCHFCRISSDFSLFSTTTIVKCLTYWLFQSEIVVIKNFYSVCLSCQSDLWLTRMHHSRLVAPQSVTWAVNALFITWPRWRHADQKHCYQLIKLRQDHVLKQIPCLLKATKFTDCSVTCGVLKAHYKWTTAGIEHWLIPLNGNIFAY